MILFLDFDGVLHAIGKHVFGDQKFSKLPLLEDWLRTHPEINVVISSSWRDTMSVEKLESFFSADIRPRIIDKCPQLPWEPEPEFWRYEEIMAWIKQTNYQGKWLALDDAVHEFPPNFDLLVVCDHEVALDQRVLKELTDRFAEL